MPTRGLRWGEAVLKGSFLPPTHDPLNSTYAAGIEVGKRLAHVKKCLELNLPFQAQMAMVGVNETTTFKPSFEK